MGHQIEYYSSKVTTEKNLKLFISSITGNAYDPRESGGYHGNLTIHKDKVYIVQSRCFSREMIILTW